MIIGKTRTNQPVESDTGFDKQVTTLIEGAESGTIEDALGLDSNGKLVKGAVSGGTQLYAHLITLWEDDTKQHKVDIKIISTKSNPFTTYNDLRYSTSNFYPVHPDYIHSNTIAVISQQAYLTCINISQVGPNIETNHQIKGIYITDFNVSQGTLTINNLFFAWSTFNQFIFEDVVYPL